jgi:hypothetical protein
MVRKSKREKLEAKGWRFGGAQEFLGLSNHERVCVERRPQMADRLQQRGQKRKRPD